MSQIRLCEDEESVGQETPPLLRHQQQLNNNAENGDAETLDQAKAAAEPPDTMPIPTIMITSPVTSPEYDSAHEVDDDLDDDYGPEVMVNVGAISEEVVVQVMDEEDFELDDEDEEEEYDIEEGYEDMEVEEGKEAVQQELENKLSDLPTIHKPVNLNFVNDFPKTTDYAKRHSFYEPKVENKAKVCHSLTFPPAYQELGTYPTEQDLLAAEQAYCQSRYNATAQIEPIEGGRRPIEVTLHRLPTHGKLLLAGSQPKDIKQYTRKDWTEDECLVETPVCGTVSIISHIGAFVWFGILVWQLRVRDEIEARKWETIDNGWYTRRVETGEECDNTLLIISGVFLGVSYLTILFEGLASYAETFLSNFITFQDALDYVHIERKVAPRIIWTLECYMNDEPVQSYTRLKDGQAVTSTDSNEPSKPKKQRVTFELPIQRCIDISGDIKGFRPGVVTRVEIDKTFGFINEYSAMQYDRLKKEFLAKYPNRVKNAKLEENLIIDGFRERMTVYFAADGRHHCMRKHYFWLFTFVFLGWPFRWWFRNNTEKTKFTIVKLVEFADEDDEAEVT